MMRLRQSDLDLSTSLLSSEGSILQGSLRPVTSQRRWDKHTGKHPFLQGKIESLHFSYERGRPGLNSPARLDNSGLLAKKIGMKGSQLRDFCFQNSFQLWIHSASVMFNLLLSVVNRSAISAIHRLYDSRDRSLGREGGSLFSGLVSIKNSLANQKNATIMRFYVTKF